MARRAARRNARMVHRGPAEAPGRRRFVTEFTGTRGREVIRRLGHDPAEPYHPGPMARCAARRNARMVHRGPAEAPERRRFVTELTGTASREVIRRFGHHRDPKEGKTRGVAGRASRPSHYTVFRLSHYHPGEGRLRRRHPLVTGSACGHRRRNVIGWFADRRPSIMTACSHTVA
jgi:hypothetical protein